MRYRSFATGNSPKRQLFDVLINYKTQGFLVSAPGVQSFNHAPAHVKSVYKGYGDEALAVLVRDYSSSGCFSLDVDFRCDVFGEPQRAMAMEHLLNEMAIVIDTEPACPIPPLHDNVRESVPIDVRYVQSM